MRRLWLALACAVALHAQGLEPGAILKPAPGTWPTYNGDYSGQRYSPLSQIDRENVGSLAMAWAFQTHSAPVKSTPLEVNGILYFTVPDDVWAVDCRTGRPVWHYHRPSTGDHVGQRGVAMFKNRLYFGTTDAHLICLDARDGKPVWDVVIADVKFGYYISVAPLVVKGRLILGTSGDSADVPHFIEAIDPENGKVVWRWNTIPKPGETGSNTWPNSEALSHGGGPAWMTGTYDPALNLIYWGTGNPHPVLAGVQRSGANLYTCSIVALDADTGKLAWYFQPSPHDTHDWDAVETPVLVDADFQGKPRKLLMQAGRNGYFFVLDRTDGKDLLTAPFVPTNWASGIDANGQPVPDKQSEPQTDGSLIHTYYNGGTNWMAPSFDPQTELFYVNAAQGYAMFYLTLNDENKPEGHQGGAANSFWTQGLLVAIDYRTGKVKWTRKGGPGGGAPGILTTAGHLLFTADTDGNLLALDPASGETLWHTYGGGAMDSSPMTYMLDGRQYVVTGVNGVVYAWALPSR